MNVLRVLGFGLAAIAAWAGFRSAAIAAESGGFAAGGSVQDLVSIGDRFHSVRRIRFSIFKRGESSPLLTLSADVGEADADDDFTLTLDNDAPPRAYTAKWVGSVNSPAVDSEASGDADGTYRSDSKAAIPDHHDWPGMALAELARGEWTIDRDPARFPSDTLIPLGIVPVSVRSSVTLPAIAVFAVPEPPSLWLLAAGFGSIAALMRRRRSA